MGVDHLGPAGQFDALRDQRILTLLGGLQWVGNAGLKFAIAGSALTVTLKTAAGNDPSPSDPIIMSFRDVTAANGPSVLRRIQTRHSLVISSGSTLGFSSATAGKLWFGLFDDTTTSPPRQRLFVVNTLSGTSIFPLGAWSIASSTAEGGAGAADSAQVFYTATAVTSMPYRILGYATWETGLSAAGTWDALPTRAQMYGPGVLLPNETVQDFGNQTGAVATGTTTIPDDDTTPQNTEGDQYMSQAIAPISAANILEIESQGIFSLSSGGEGGMLLCQDNVGNSLAANRWSTRVSGLTQFTTVFLRMLAATTSSTTFKIRAGGFAAATTTFNGVAAARKFGGVLNSYIKVKEIAT